MRTILEIIETAKNGQHIEKDEAYWTMLALDILLADEQQALSTVTKAVIDGKQIRKTAVLAQQGSFNRLYVASKMRPDELVRKAGRAPDSPEYQEKRKAMKDLARAKQANWAASNGARN